MVVQCQERPTSLESLRKGKLTPGDKRDGEIREMPTWVDKEKLNRAKELYNEYSACVHFAHLSGLMMIFLYTKIIEPFLFTEESSNFVSLLRRYVATADHVRKWYLGDIWDPRDEAYKSLMVVKKMHRNVAIKMNDSNSCNDFLYVSQSGMAMTQFAFVGLIVLFPEKFAIDWKDSDMECFLHHWRCVGYLLGMDDKFNICIGNYNEVHSLFKDILDNEMKPGIRKPLKESVQMARDIIKVFGSFTRLLTWKSLSHYWKEELDIPQDYVLSLYDKMVALWFRLALGILLWNRWIRRLFNYFSTYAIKRALNNMPFYEGIVLNYEKNILSQKKEN